MGEYSWDISSKQGGYCKITVDYTLAGTHPSPGHQQLSGNFLLDCCNNALLSVENDFANIFSVLGYPAFVLQSAIQQLTSIPAMISRITQFGGLFGGDSVDVAEPLDFNALVTYPAKLSTSLSTLIRTENSSAATIDDSFSVYENLISALPNSDATAIYNTPSRKQQQQNQQAIDQLIKGVATVEAARTMADRQASFSNYSAAIAMQNTLLTALDHSIESGSDNAYPALANLQSAIIKRVDDIAPGLQRIEHIELAQSVPALVLAHQLYQTADNADELIARNKLAHPLFVPAGQQLEVLT
jgi:prophage DNA circulation protein